MEQNKKAPARASYKNVKQKVEGSKGCPYCGAKVNYFYRWGMKSKGELLCNKCGNCSDVKLMTALPFIGWGAVVLSAILFAIFALTGFTQFWLLIMMILPFLFFTLISPFFIRFVKIDNEKIMREKIEKEQREKEKFYEKRKIKSKTVKPDKEVADRIKREKAEAKRAEKAEKVKTKKTPRRAKK